MSHISQPPKRKSTTSAPQSDRKTKSTRKKPPTSSRARKAHFETTKQEKPWTTQLPECLEAFRLYAVPRSAVAQDEDEDEAEEEDDEDDEQDEDVRAEKRVIRIPDVRRALKALNLPKPPPGFFDDDYGEEGFLRAAQFVELAQTMAESEIDAAGDDACDESEEQQREIDHAFALFTHSLPLSAEAAKGNGKGPVGRTSITLADLKRVARELREDVDEKTLKLMIAEANGGHESHGASWEQGVCREEFENVMKRAGVFG